MVDGGDQTPSGPAADLVRQAGDKVDEIAGWLQNREPGDLVNEVRAFARRKPGVFLLGAALAGVVAGRLTTGVVAAHKDGDGSTTTGHTPQQAYGSTYAEGSYTTGTNYVADTPATGYSTPAYGTTGSEAGTTAGSATGYETPGYETPGTTTSGTTTSGTTTPGYSTTGTTGAVPPPPYGTVPSEGTTSGWDDRTRTSGEDRP
jgi:hypothetical protein